MKKFVNNYSIMWGMGRYEIRLWRKFPWKLEFIDYGLRVPLKWMETYVCAGCGKTRPWCDGAADDMPDHCDECWDKAHLPWWRRLWRWVRHAGRHHCTECAPRPVKWI